MQEITYWAQLNKNVVAQILTTGIPNGVLNLPILSTKPPDPEWNTDNPAFITAKKLDGSSPHFAKPGAAGKIDASGAAILLDFVGSLAVLAGLLQKAARSQQGANRNELLRLASECLFIQKQILTQAWTVIRGIEEFQKFQPEILQALGFS